MPAGQKVYVIRTKCAAIATITYGLVDLNKPLLNFRTIGSSNTANTDAYILIKGGFSVGFNAGVAVSTSLPNLMGYSFTRGAIYQSQLGGTVYFSGSRACIQFWGK